MSTPATMEELRTHYEVVRKTLVDERAMRQVVFRNDPQKLARKLAEIDGALLSLAALKDAAKLEVEKQPQQAQLW